jgi:hypothetical protein
MLPELPLQATCSVKNTKQQSEKEELRDACEGCTMKYKACVGQQARRVLGGSCRLQSCEASASEQTHSLD